MTFTTENLYAIYPKTTDGSIILSEGQKWHFTKKMVHIVDENNRKIYSCRKSSITHAENEECTVFLDPKFK